MRNIVFRFDSSPSFARALRDGDQELAPPPGESIGEGEWVLAIFELGERRRATASAARGLLRGSAPTPVLAFERRDWERLLDFADAGSVGLQSAARPASAGSVPPPGPSEPPPPPTLPPPSPRAPSSPPLPALERTALGIPGPSSSPTHRSLDRTTLGVAPSPQPPKAPAEVLAPAPAPLSTGRTQAWPVAPAPAPRAPATPLARVLLVDDDRHVCEIVAAMLDAIGLAVESAGSAEKALESLRASRYDLLVLDWNLPGMTGIELCRLIRKDAKLAALPVIFLSARTASQDIVDAFASGADDYVSKPFRAPELGARIFGLLRRARMTAELP